MELLQLRYFQAVARREHVSQAAADLHVAQPSVSRSIARLEAELGAPLFDRQGRRVRLNRFGAAYLRRVDRALGELDDARRTGEVDLGLASQPLQDPSLSTIELVREEVLLAVPPTHPLAHRKRINITALAEQPFITTRPGHWLRALADQLFTTAGLKPAIACEGDEPTAIRALISAGLGIGLLPESSRQGATHPPVAWLHLNTRHARRTLTLAWRTDAYLSTAAQHFREIATERIRQTTVNA